jgi:hypothetical protein
MREIVIRFGEDTKTKLPTASAPWEIASKPVSFYGLG